MNSIIILEYILNNYILMQYLQRLQKLVYLYLSTDVFMEVSLHSSGPKISLVVECSMDKA